MTKRRQDDPGEGRSSRGVPDSGVPRTSGKKAVDEGVPPPTPTPDDSGLGDDFERDRRTGKTYEGKTGIPGETDEQAGDEPA